MAEVGLYYLGAQASPAARRKSAKSLFNALDNDGSLEAWLRRYGVGTEAERRGHAPMPPFGVDGGAAVFSLPAYVASRAQLTAEFKRRMPAMTAFVHDWLAIHDPARVPRHELTAKSYFLQEAEGISRLAKLAWAERRGSGSEVTSLQHDGVVMVLGEGVAPGAATAALSAACEEALGYAQPVEEKPLGAPDDPESGSDDGDGGGGDG